MKRKNHAFTLLELVITIAIMSVIGLSVAGVSVALSTAHANSQSAYENIQASRNTLIGIQRVLNRARLIVATDSQTVLYWVGDANGDGAINISELVALWYDAENKGGPQRKRDPRLGHERLDDQGHAHWQPAVQ